MKRSFVTGFVLLCVLALFVAFIVRRNAERADENVVSEPNCLEHNQDRVVDVPPMQGEYESPLITKTVSGEAPPYFGSTGHGSELWYGIILPKGEALYRLDVLDHDGDDRNEICVWTDRGNIFYLSFAGELKGLGRSDGATGGAEFRLVRMATE